LAGPSGPADDYAELYNPTADPIDLGGWRLSYTGGTAAIAAGTLPSHAHFLIAGSQYSLDPYAAPDLAPAGLNLPSSGGVRVLALDSASTDAAGATTAAAVYREGTGLPTPTQSSAQVGFARVYAAGVPVDTDNNAADFQFVATDAATNAHGAGAALGMPGPMDLASPLVRNDIAQSYLLDATKSATVAPNRVYDATAKTLTVRRTITNTSSTETITALRLRITGLTTYGTATASQAILTARSSTNETVGGKAVMGTALDTASQLNGGGIGSTLTVPLPAGGLAPGQSVNIDLLFNVVRGGTFSFAYNAEAGTG
jgi:hypothetical protein